MLVEDRKVEMESTYLRSDNGREQSLGALVAPLVFIALCLTPELASADRFSVLLERAKLAHQDNDIVAARAAVEEAYEVLSKPQVPATTVVGSDIKDEGSAGSPLAASTGASARTVDKEEEKTVFARLADKGWRLQLGPGLSGPDAGSATFAFARDIAAGTDTEFNSNFTLGYSPGRRSVSVTNKFTGESIPGAPSRFGADNFLGFNNAIWVWDASVQGQLASSADDKANAWTFRLGGDIWHYGTEALKEAERAAEAADGLSFEVQAESSASAVRPSSFYRSSTWSVNGKLEADQDFDNQRGSLELTVTPSTLLPGNGRWWPNDVQREEAFMRFIWRPYFGLDAGGQLASDGTIDPVDDTLRLTGRMTAGLSFDFLQRALGLEGVWLNVDDTVYYLTESGQGFNYLTTGLNFDFTDYLGFAFTYQNGEVAPTFERTETFAGAFAVKF